LVQLLLQLREQLGSERWWKQWCRQSADLIRRLYDMRLLQHADSSEAFGAKALHSSLTLC
jgi:hypothetical protein